MKHRRLPLAPLFGVLVLALTACSSSGGGAAPPPKPTPLSGYVAEQAAVVSGYQTFQGGLSYPLLQVEATLPASSPLKPALAAGLARMLVQSVRRTASAVAATPALTYDGTLGLYESGFTISGAVITDHFYSDSAGTQSAGTLSVTYPSGTTIPALGQASATPPYTMTIAANITAGNLPISGSGTIALQDSTGAGEIKGTFTLTKAQEAVTADLSLSDTGAVTGTAQIAQSGETISVTGLSGPFNGTINGNVAVAPQGYTGTVAMSIFTASFTITLNTGKGTASGTVTPQGALAITFDDGTTETLLNPVTTSPTATPNPTPPPPATYTIGGTVSGLAAGTQMVLQDNGGDNLAVTTNGAFTFATALGTGVNYAVTVNTQPTGQTCTVSQGTGTTGSANVANVAVTCSANAASTYSIGGTLSGLTPGSGIAVVLQDNGGDNLTLTANGAFTFATKLLAGASYAVTVNTQPTGQTCTVSNFGAGTVGAANVTTVSVTCTTGTPTATETVLHSFGATATDGATPSAGLIMDSSGNFYGTTETGGPNNVGTVFKITPTGTESVLHSFGATATDGTLPFAGLVMDGSGNLYGTTTGGGVPTGVGAHSQGTVFKITPAGTETILYSFTGGSDGGNPEAGLLMDSGGNLYGTTQQGGSSNDGTVFKLTPAGNKTILHSFAGGADGSGPLAALIMDGGGNLYGTTTVGGSSNNGTVFKLTPAGNETILHSFAGGADGSGPRAGLIMDSSGNLYGTTYQGGSSNNGTVFKITPSGAESVLHDFGATATDGTLPLAGLIMDGNGNLYGTTSLGVGSEGTVFKITPAGTETILYTFTGGSDGGSPEAGLVMGSNGNLYGTTYAGGAGSLGTVFEITP